MKKFFVSSLRVMFTAVGVLYIPVYLTAWVLRIICRVFLCIAYFFMFDFNMAKDVAKSLFKWQLLYDRNK